MYSNARRDGAPTSVAPYKVGRLKAQYFLLHEADGLRYVSGPFAPHSYDTQAVLVTTKLMTLSSGSTQAISFGSHPICSQLLKHASVFQIEPASALNWSHILMKDAGSCSTPATAGIYSTLTFPRHWQSGGPPQGNQV